MNLRLALAALLVVAATPAAWAQGGTNLFWDDCSTGGATDRSFACDGNAGDPFTMVVSVVPPQNVPQLNGVWVAIWAEASDATVPAWWSAGDGQCRQGAVTGSFDPAANPSGCPDLWQGTANLSVFHFAPGLTGPNSFLLRGAAAVAPGSEVSVVADGTELYVCKIVVTRSKTTGTGNCPGCDVGACLVLVECRLTQPDGAGDFVLSTADVNNWITWQGGGSLQCPGSVPTRQRTWGAVKGLYR